MGANAQTSVPTFTAGEVLTAANMNISARTGVPVFADTTARDAAFGGTGEKTLAEGQMAYVENLTGDAQIQYYDGSTWNSLGAAGLTLVSSTTIGTAVSSVTVSSAFSSTYDTYRIVISGGAGSTATSVLLTLGSQTTGYKTQVSVVDMAGGAFTQSASTVYIGTGRMSANGLFGFFELNNPFLSKDTFCFSTGAEPAAGTYTLGMANATTSFTAFTLTTGSGTMTGGTVRVYGYKN